MAAVMLYAHRNLTCTDSSCSWTIRKTKTGFDYAVPIEDILESKRKNKNKKETEELEKATYVPVSEPVNFFSTDEELANILKNIDNCKGGAVSFGWLISKEPAAVENEIEGDTKQSPIFINFFFLPSKKETKNPVTVCVMQCNP